MPDPKRLRVYYEGDDDRNVLEGLERADLLPSNSEIAKRDKTRPGQEGMIQDLIAFVAVGLPEDSRLRQEHGVVRFAVDDYLLNLVRAPDVYSSVSELEGVSFEKAMSKLHAMTGMLRSNGIPVEHSKRLLHLLRAI